MSHGLTRLRTKRIFVLRKSVLFPQFYRHRGSFPQSEFSGSENLLQTWDQSPLLPAKAPPPSLELRLTQRRNIIAFKAHLKSVYHKTHSPELSESSHQSHSSVKTELNGQIFMKMRSNIIQCENAPLIIYPIAKHILVWLLFFFAIHRSWSQPLFCNSLNAELKRMMCVTTCSAVTSAPLLKVNWSLASVSHWTNDR